MPTESTSNRRTVLQSTAVGIAGLLAGCSGILGGGGSGGSGSWISHDADPGNTSANTHTSGPSSKPTLTKMYEPSGFSGVSTTPVFDGSTIAVWGSDGALHGVDTDGTERWRFSLELDILEDVATPAMLDGTVYLPAGDTVVAVAGGERQWATAGPGGQLSAPRVDERGLYLSGDGSLGVLELDGTERWTETGLEGDVSHAAVEGDRLFHFQEIGGGAFSFEEPTWRLVARNVSDGSVLWSEEGTVRGSYPVVRNGRIFVWESTDSGYHVVAVSADDGSVLWRSDVLPSANDVTPTVTDDALYVATEDELHALNPADGTSLWDQPYTFVDGPSHAPRTDGDAVYVLVGNGTLVAVDAASGQQRWSFGFESDISFGGLSNVSVANGSIYTSRDALVQLR